MVRQIVRVQPFVRQAHDADLCGGNLDDCAVDEFPDWTRRQRARHHLNSTHRNLSEVTRRSFLPAGWVRPLVTDRKQWSE